MKRPEIVGRVANYVAIVNGMWKIVPDGFTVRIYPGFCPTVYNRKLIFPSIFRQLFRIIANGIFKGFPRWRVPDYAAVRWIIDFRPVLFAARYTQPRDIFVASILSFPLFRKLPFRCIGIRTASATKVVLYPMAMHKSAGRS